MALPLGEPRDRLGVVVRVEHRLGEERDATDRGLQLVADVGEEVAADLLDAGGLGAVLDEEEHVVGAERRDAGGHDEAAVADALLQGQLGLADDAVAAHSASEVQQLGVDQLLTAHETLGDRGRRVVDHAVGGVDEDPARAQDRDDLTDARRQGRRGRGRRLGCGRAVRQAHGDHRQAAQGEAGDATERCRGRRVHDTQRTHRRERLRPRAARSCGA